MKLARPATDILQEKFAVVRKELTAALIERDDEIDVVLTALIANEHALFVGNPGTAKSMLLDSLLTWTGGKKFSILLTKFSVPEEVCGAISLAALREDRFIRITTGKLPEADYAFIDECFKASSAILNTLLKILNERTFDAGDGVARKVPLAGEFLRCVRIASEFGPRRGNRVDRLLATRRQIEAHLTFDEQCILFDEAGQFDRPTIDFLPNLLQLLQPLCDGVHFREAVEGRSQFGESSQRRSGLRRRVRRSRNVLRLKSCSLLLAHAGCDGVQLGNEISTGGGQQRFGVGDAVGPCERKLLLNPRFGFGECLIQESCE